MTLTKKDFDKIEQIAVSVSGSASTARMSQLAKETTKEVVTEMFLVCGIDYSNPVKMQELMAYGKECQELAAKNKKILNWAEEAMNTNKVFKKNFIAEAGKHGVTVIIAFAAMWYASVKGIIGG